MDWQPPHRAERRALCDLALALGPGAPTLCEGWDAERLVGHLWVREHDPVAAAGIVVPALADRHEVGIDRAVARHGFTGLVQRVRSGPPALLRPLDAAINTVELFVHHEDLRRGDGTAGPRSPLEVQSTEAALWSRLPRLAPLLTRDLGEVGLVLRAPGLGEVTAHRRGTGATLVGRPGELVLYLYGRRDAAHVEVEGSAADRTALAEASLGL